MYAIIEQGGTQYKVSQGDKINIDLTDLPEQGDKLELTNVMLVNDGEQVKIGKPYIEGAKVIAQLTEKDGSVVKGPKLYPTHFRRRKNSKKRIGHRQKYLQVLIDSIEA